jgi:O-acetyl-ADP-ribose deacetylase (regulator of RNase III)
MRPPEDWVITFAYGDATRPRAHRSLIAHVVNDATPNWGGKGFAVTLRRAYPSAQEEFRRWWRLHKQMRLGAVHILKVSPTLWIASMIAQHGYGPARRPRLRYDALKTALAEVAQIASTYKLRVQMPRIGTGQAGGKWEVIEPLISEAFSPSGSRVTVLDLPQW